MIDPAMQNFCIILLVFVTLLNYRALRVAPTIESPRPGHASAIAIHAAG